MDAVSTNTRQNRGETAKLGPYSGSNSVTSNTVCPAIYAIAIAAIGMVQTFQPNGKVLVDLNADDNGGLINVFNKTGEDIAQIYADVYGSGVVWAGNRKGKGRELKPGP